MNLFYRKDGTPYEDDDPEFEWAKDFEDFDYKRVADDILPDGKRVSTVWVGIDLGYRSSDRPPLIFESMVFMNDKRFDELECVRYSTEEAAKIGHAALVEKWSSGLKT